ncbi:hypothetical protein CUJ84_Chr003359 [Rhizobium leguminosarum]|uniref:Uncharacterized protein n=1 Tax=Rhizobium leguminosarum TaxID=384 RepID=A0A2K9Z661_RHILE|nr:hypothetical protein CUJ84_Chr003359 [Rhizobium leguminosarum]
MFYAIPDGKPLRTFPGIALTIGTAVCERVSAAINGQQFTRLGEHAR